MDLHRMLKKTSQNKLDWFPGTPFPLIVIGRELNDNGTMLVKAHYIDQTARFDEWRPQYRSQDFLGWASRPPGSQNEEENDQNLRKNNKNFLKFEEK